MGLPNLVIGGAPKCGTTSMYDWLEAHPAVCGSRSKEPFFLVDADNPLRRNHLNIHDHGLEAYSKAFPRRADHCEVVMEGSTHYLYESTALDVLPSLPSNPRLLFIVRKPSERVFSSYAYYKSKGSLRGDPSFAEVLARIGGGGGASSVSDWARGTSAYVLPRDIRYSRYVDYLLPWRDRLGPERMKVILFETMRANPQPIVQEVCDWLGIDRSFYDDFAFRPRNRTSSVRSRAVRDIARVFSGAVRSGPFKEALKRVYFAVQATSRREERTPADKAAIAQLEREFRPANEKLAQEFGLDLSAWE